MEILVTGSRGKLGTEICLELNKSNIDYVRYSQCMSLNDINWKRITHIVNCAAVIPNNSLASYWNGNVKFITELLEYSSGKHFIHFSSLSEQYKFDDYQITKILGSNIISCNSHIFKSLQIIPVPTLDDSSLISLLIEKSKTEKILVDRLKYNYINVEELANLVVKSIKKIEKINILESFIEKDLYEEIKQHVDPEQIIEGQLIDRTSVKNNLITFSPSLFEELSEKKKLC